MFTPQRSYSAEQVYSFTCSQPCAQAHRFRERQRARLAIAEAAQRYVPDPHHPDRRMCWWCGNEFEATKWNARYCRRPHARKAESFRRDLTPRDVPPPARIDPEGGPAQPLRRFAISPSRRAKLYARDNYRCHLCGHVVDVSVLAGPRAATLDHIVPRSHGGDDYDPNLRTAHMWCNWLRGNSPELPWFDSPPPETWRPGQTEDLAACR